MHELETHRHTHRATRCFYKPMGARGEIEMTELVTRFSLLGIRGEIIKARNPHCDDGFIGYDYESQEWVEL